MKNVKKIFAMALALIMVLGLATTASAYDITINNSADGSTVAGHTYEVYQIFTGDLEDLEGNKVLTNIVYGANYAGDDDIELEDLLALLADMDGEEAAEYLVEGLINDPIATLDDEHGYTASGLDVGYYLIIDVTENLPENETASAFILEVTDNVTIKSKHTSGPIVEKKIDDTNDSTDATNEIIWHDSADHDIGDSIPFELVMTVPSAFQLFKDKGVAYPFTFHDTEEQGLAFENITGVYVINGEEKVEIESGYELIPAPGHDLDKDGKNCTFDVCFEDLTAIENVAVGSVIIVEYTSTLTEEAILGNQGNVNEVYGEFRNYYEPEVPVFTPKDTVIAFTYKVVVNKIDENDVPLAGAKFTLEKFVASENGTVEYPEASGIMGGWVALKTVETTPETTFTFKGLDDGFYRLTETDAPDGYNKIDPIEFTVTAEHDIEWNTQGRTDVLKTLTGDVVTGEIEFTKDVTEGSFSANVVNKKGTILPETGGIGTKIFTFGGAALVAIAVILLVTKKRMTASK